MHIALILLPAISYILLTLVLAAKLHTREVLEAFVKGHLVLFAFVAISTEILSFFDGISFFGVLASWLLLVTICFGLFLKKKGRLLNLPPDRPKTTTYAKILAVFFIVILLATFDTAFLYPPNNVDSLIYHMARVAHWINAGNVSFYPTAIENQLFMMPLAEFAIMHVQILTGSDLFANHVQWLNFAVLISLGALVGSELGLSTRKQLIAAVAITAMPMAILQASSTQNDLVVSSFIMAFALYMLRLRNNFSSVNLLLVAFSLGFALLTKGTAYIYCAALGLSLAVPIFLDCKNEKARLLRISAGLTLVVVFALLLNGGHLWRNYRLYGTPMPKQEGFVNEDKSAKALLSNILRNGVLHLVTPFRQLTDYQANILYSILGPEMSNPKTTFEGEFGLHYIPRKEDYQGNLIHMGIVLFGLVLLPLLWRKGHYRNTMYYAAGILLGGLLFCWFLKWQIWGSRLHTPLFALAAPLIAIVIPTGTSAKGKLLGHSIVFCMVFYSLQFAFANESRSLISLEWYKNDRFQNYFNRDRTRLHDYHTAMVTLYSDIIKTVDSPKAGGSEAVGLYLSGSGWEYPFWVFADQAGEKGNFMTFRHVGVGNVSKTIDESDFIPRYVIGTEPLTWEHAGEYQYIYNSSQIYVLKRSI